MEAGLWRDAVPGTLGLFIDVFARAGEVLTLPAGLNCTPCGAASAASGRPPTLPARSAVGVFPTLTPAPIMDGAGAVVVARTEATAVAREVGGALDGSNGGAPIMAGLKV
jgi:hypothetical protein